MSSGLVLSSLWGNTEREREDEGEQGESFIGEQRGEFCNMDTGDPGVIIIWWWEMLFKLSTSTTRSIGFLKVDLAVKL